MKQKIGSHISISGGYTKATKKANALSGDCLQIFSSAPVRWATRSLSDDEISGFRQECEEYGLDPVYFHAPYLINLANDNDVGEKSVAALIKELELASELGVKGSVIHLGSFTQENATLTGNEPGYDTFISRIQKVLDNTPEDTLFIAENSGNRKIGKNIEDLGRVAEEVDSDRFGVCLDTCHLHAAGYDISTKPKLNSFLESFDDIVGKEYLEVWHVNDSKDEFGSLRDRHANIGDGEIPLSVFENILNHPDLKSIPFILETPGYDTPYKDEKNIKQLKDLIR